MSKHIDMNHVSRVSDTEMHCQLSQDDTDTQQGVCRTVELQPEVFTLAPLASK